MQRVIITGANGTGKSHVAARLAEIRPDLPLVSYDALRLTQNWVKKSADDITTALLDAIGQDAWVLEGGPSLLNHALFRCQGAIWLDPPEHVRAQRLALRPLKNLGKTRAELPPGNVDWPLQQYAFALRSLGRGRQFRHEIETKLRAHPPPYVWRCRTQRDVEAAIKAVAQCLHHGSDHQP